MPDQHGRCLNTEFCDAAVSNRIVSVPEDAPFRCTKCGEPLKPLADGRARGGRAVWITAQVAAVMLGGSVVAWRLYGAPATGASPAAGPAPAARSAALVTGTSFVAPPAPAAAPASATAPAPPSTPNKLLLRVAGPDAASSSLLQRLASGYLALIGDTGIAVTPAAAGATDVAGLQGSQREAIRLIPASSDAGFDALLRGAADMAATTRKVTPNEAERLAPVGDLTNPANELVIGAQGIAVIVSPANPVPSLTVAQLRAILSGRVKDWSEVGGAAGLVRLYTFDNRDGRADAAEDFLLGDDGVSSAATRVATEPNLASAVAGDRDGIGFVTRGNAGNARVVPVAEGNAIPVQPTDIAIATEVYPLTRRLYLYMAGDMTGGFGRRFSDYVTSPAGQAVVEASGLVGLNVLAVPTALPDTASDRLRQLTAGSNRISVTFRFKPNSTELDSRGVRDLERLAAYLKAQRINSNRVVLAAFADNSGPASVNQAVAQRRADAVSAAMAKAGIPAGKTAAFGADLPVADNSTGDGRERNRRVEVYLAP